jgi:hypothetical protein
MNSIAYWPGANCDMRFSLPVTGYFFHVHRNPQPHRPASVHLMSFMFYFDFDGGVRACLHAEQPADVAQLRARRKLSRSDLRFTACRIAGHQRPGRARDSRS